MPNGVVVEYSYDAASRLTGLTYRQGVTVLGDLTYLYDVLGLFWDWKLRPLQGAGAYQ